MLNPIQFMNMFSQAPNPREMAMNIINQNPQSAQIMEQIKNSTNNADPQQIALQMGKQVGLSEQQVHQMYSMFNK